MSESKDPMPASGRLGVTLLVLGAVALVVTRTIGNPAFVMLSLVVLVAGLVLAVVGLVAKSRARRDRQHQELLDAAERRETSR